MATYRTLIILQLAAWLVFLTTLVIERVPGFAWLYCAYALSLCAIAFAGSWHPDFRDLWAAHAATLICGGVIAYAVASGVRWAAAGYPEKLAVVWIVGAFALYAISGLLPSSRGVVVLQSCVVIVPVLVAAYLIRSHIEPSVRLLLEPRALFG